MIQKRNYWIAFFFRHFEQYQQEGQSDHMDTSGILSNQYLAEMKTV